MSNNVDQPRDDHGRWTSGGSMGRQPVKSSAGQPSVHTHLSAKAERIAMRQAVDERHFPSRTDSEVAATTDLIGTRVTPGRIDPRVNDAAKKLIKSIGG
jgi:hypothetical protein